LKNKVIAELSTLAESRQLFESANQPKDLWIVPQAEHGDFLKNAPQDYEEKVYVL
jgi:hypothetical protein